VIQGIDGATTPWYKGDENAAARCRGAITRYLAQGAHKGEHGMRIVVIAGVICTLSTACQRLKEQWEQREEITTASVVDVQSRMDIIIPQGGGDDAVAGAVIGGLAAGPVGAVVGATVGDNDDQRRAVIGQKLAGCRTVLRVDGHLFAFLFEQNDHGLNACYFLRSGDRVYVRRWKARDTMWYKWPPDSWFGQNGSPLPDAPSDSRPNE